MWVDRHPILTVTIYVLAFLALVVCAGNMVRILANLLT